VSVISADGLLKQLGEQWAHAGRGAEHGVLRACSMTLVVLAGSGDGQELGETLAELMTEHPARAIVVRLAPQAQEALEARTLVQCWRPFGRRRQICCEQVEIVCAPEGAAEARRLLLGLLVADLPVTVWVREPRWLEVSGAASLFEIAGKVIVDGGRMAAAEALRKLNGLTEGARADLAWTRITRWRELVRMLAGGRALRSAAIGYAGPELPVSALYLGAWLRNAYGERLRLDLESEGPGRPPAGHGLIRTLTLGGAAGEISLRRPPGVNVDACAEGRMARYRFPLFTPQHLLRAELGVLGQDPSFELALATAGSMLKAEGHR
jgi:hypothetical protein